MSRKLKPIPFGDRPGPEPYNASEVVAVTDSTFLFCDNNVSDALFEFRVGRDGTKRGAVVRRRIEGLPPGAIDDIEGIEIVEAADRTFIFGSSSMCLKTRKGHHKKEKRGKAVAARESIIRITLGRRNRLHAEVISGFRPWLVERHPWLKRYAGLIPDDGGLNVEALSWDPRRRAMLFGLRTPLLDGKPVVLRVRPKKIDGAWSLDNLEVLEPLTLAVPKGRHDAGIRAMSLDQSTGHSLIVLGNSTSESKARFRLYTWDGNPHGRVCRYRDVKFHKQMKVEGVTRGKVRRRPAMIFVDDGGGYQLLWADDPRLASVARV